MAAFAVDWSGGLFPFLKVHMATDTQIMIRLLKIPDVPSVLGSLHNKHVVAAGILASLLDIGADRGVVARDAFHGFVFEVGEKHGLLPDFDFFRFDDQFGLNHRNGRPLAEQCKGYRSLNRGRCFLWGSLRR